MYWWVIVLLTAPLWIPAVMIFAFWVKEKKLETKYARYVENVINSTSQRYPWLATQISDLKYMNDEETATRLRTKSHPAYKAAEQVSKIAKEKRELIKQNKMLEYQMNFLLNTLPWLEEYIEITPEEARSVASQQEEKREESYERYRNWLSPNEYKILPTAKKYQLALDRYMKQPKSDWQAGINYERFVGYHYETDGYKVQYTGALMKFDDMGRDLIATKGKETLVIQCKRRRTGAVVHENTVFQTYGTAVLYQLEHPEQTVKAVVCTTTNLSDTAKRIADFLNVQCIENYSLGDYPMIKCNIAKSGEKIYHLPFDQQYDRVQITGKKGARYVSTVSQAESLGFRRAFRWHPDQN